MFRSRPISLCTRDDVTSHLMVFSQPLLSPLATHTTHTAANRTAAAAAKVEALVTFGGRTTQLLYVRPYV